MNSENLPAANFLVRVMLGSLFLMAGIWKVFDLGAAAHAEQFFVNGFTDTWIPVWLLTSLGYSIPYLELVAGATILIGFRTREALIALGVLLLVTTYGHALLEPLFDIAGHTFTRMALIIFLLLMPAGSDRLSADHLIASRHGRS
jgi:uncharacterized membrane protein YphA (DoxX/SURF4 family)